MYDIEAISVQQTNWQALRSYSQELLNVNPIRNLDSVNIDLKDPAAFIAALGFGESAKEFLRKAKQTNVLNHSSMSFVASLDDELIEKFSTVTNLNMWIKRGRGLHLVILTGTMDDWYEAVRSGCRSDVDKDFRILMSKVFNIFQNTSYREVFSNLNRVSESDGSIILKD